MIKQGDIYWVSMNDPNHTDIVHPHVVIQENELNQSGVHTVVVCALTTNMRKINSPGNVLLEAGEGNLPKQSIVEVAKVLTVERTQLGEYVGSLSEERISQILAGMEFVKKMTGDR